MDEVLVVGHIKAEGMAVLERRTGVRVTVVDEARRSEIIDAAAAATAILARTAPIDAAVIGAAPRLRVVSRHGVGYDNVDVAALNARRIPLAISATANAVSVAEHAMTMLLMLAKDGLGHDAAVRAGNWRFRNEMRAFELMGRRLLLVGFGRIGREVAIRARAFGMAIDVFDPFLDAAALTETGAELVSDLDEALARADAVSLHLPLNAATRNLIDARRLKLMRREALLVNTARGGLIDEAALAAALHAGEIRGAGLDVFADEPPATDSPLFAAPRLLVSPHNAGVTDESMVRMATEAATNILAVLDGKLERGVIVNLDAIAAAETSAAVER
jgi:D-3-phosphoglycerate dehydrogenase